MSKLDNYTTLAKSELNKTVISNEAFALAEVITELTRAINNLSSRLNG